MYPSLCSCLLTIEVNSQDILSKANVLGRMDLTLFKIKYIV